VLFLLSSRDVSCSGDASIEEDEPHESAPYKCANNDATNLTASGSHQPQTQREAYFIDEEGDEDTQTFFERHSSLRFLLAGGIAGAGKLGVHA